MVYGLVRAHKGTSEWSVQGLSESMAALVECGHRMRRKVWVCESLLPEMAREGTLLDGLGSEANDGEDMEGLERRNVDEEGENFSESAYSQEEGRARPPPELDTALPGHAAEDEQDGRGQEETEEQRAKREKERNIYYARLPMLNGSSHREGLGDRGGWSGRTVEVGVVMKRWTTFTSIEL